MKRLIQRIIQDSNEVLLCVDANKEWTAKNSKIKEMAITLGLSDLVHTVLGESPPTFTRQGVNSTLYYVEGTTTIMETVSRVQMAPTSWGDMICDHRGIVIDFDIKLLLNMDPMDLSSPTSRKLKSGDIKGVKKYKKLLRNSLDRHRVIERMKELLRELEGVEHMNPFQLKLYEGIDNDMHRLCINAERGIRRGRDSKFVWSPILDNADAILQYWKRRKKFYR